MLASRRTLWTCLVKIEKLPKGKKEVGNFCGSDYIPTQNTAELIFALTYKRILQIWDLKSDQKLPEVFKKLWGCFFPVVFFTTKICIMRYKQ